MYHDIPYLEALDYILDFGEKKPNRTGIDTIGVFNLGMNWDINEYFPLLTTKKLHWKSIITELLWFIRGDTNVKWLNDRGVTIWDEWVKDDGTIGPGYGRMWRNFGGVDQLQQVVDTLKTNPNDRRMIVSAWNPPLIPDMSLPPCHMLYQFYVREGKYLDCRMDQRSCDMFLGVPYNVASYSALVYIIAHITGFEPGRFYWNGGDCHIYENHIEQVKTQLERGIEKSPKLKIVKGPDGLDGWDIDNFKLIDYTPKPAIKAEVAV